MKQLDINKPKSFQQLKEKFFRLDAAFKDSGCDIGANSLAYVLVQSANILSLVQKMIFSLTNKNSTNLACRHNWNFGPIFTVKSSTPCSRNKSANLYFQKCFS
jgi:hypothetical protein